MHDFQLCVRYTHQRMKYGQPLDALPYSTFSLPLARHLLVTNRALRITLIGDSISCGANASEVTQVPPFSRPYYHLLVDALKERYGADIHLRNFSKGGETSKYTFHRIDEIVASKADVGIIAFGMNDATQKISPRFYKETIQSLIRRIRLQLPRCELILIASLLPNPIWSLSNLKYHEGYLEELTQICQNESQAALADCHTLSKELYQRKHYHDLSGNHINHPNDWMHLQYARQIGGLFGLSWSC